MCDPITLRKQFNNLRDLVFEKIRTDKRILAGVEVGVMSDSCPCSSSYTVRNESNEGKKPQNQIEPPADKLTPRIGCQKRAFSWHN